MLVTNHRLVEDQRGSVLPIFALLIVILLVFAAFAVDLGAAWAQRRQSQTAADAGVMAAALEYLRDTPSDESGIFNLVNDYANSNLTGPNLTWSDWARPTCTDPDRPIDYDPLGTSGLLDGDGDGTAGDITDCISIKQVDNEPAILRVRLPDKDVPTAFASVIGIDSIPVSAFAEAEIRYLESSKIIPFALPADAGEEECLNTPPNGQLPDVTPGCGSDSGNFGFLDLNWYGSPDPHDNVAQSCGNTPYPNFASRTPANLALGIDHVLTPWPDEAGDGLDIYPPYTGYDGPAIDTDVPSNDPYVDSCTSAASGIPPYAVKTETGNAQLLDAGLLGTPQFGLNNAPGRLRQDTPYAPTSWVSSADTRLTLSDNAETFDVDNVGLWEYLDFGAIGGSDDCSLSEFSTKEGRALTDQMHLCLTDGNPQFKKEIIDSPRFSLVPVLNYTTQSGTDAWAIITMRPIYIQTTWYACKDNQSLDPWCMFTPDGFDTYVPPAAPLVVELTAPSDLALISGTNVSIEADASVSNGNSIVDVEFFVDGSSVGSDTPPPNPNYSVVWDSTSKKKDGPVTISAVVTDDEGNTATDTITVAVNNKGGQAPPTPPARQGKSIFFNPGEGSAEPCLPDKNDENCINPNEMEVDGMTALVILQDWLPESIKNTLGSSSPFEVYLRR